MSRANLQDSINRKPLMMGIAEELPRQVMLGMEDERLWEQNDRNWPAYKGSEHWMSARRMKRRHWWTAGGAAKAVGPTSGGATRAVARESAYFHWWIEVEASWVASMQALVAGGRTREDTLAVCVDASVSQIWWTNGSGGWVDYFASLCWSVLGRSVCPRGPFQIAQNRWSARLKML
jgi:hypothetical protein